MTQFKIQFLFLSYFDFEKGAFVITNIYLMIINEKYLLWNIFIRGQYTISKSKDNYDYEVNELESNACCSAICNTAFLIIIQSVHLPTMTTCPPTEVIFFEIKMNLFVVLLFCIYIRRKVASIINMEFKFARGSGCLHLRGEAENWLLLHWIRTKLLSEFSEIDLGLFL